MNRREVILKFALGGTTLVVLPAFLASCDKDPGPADNNTGGGGGGGGSGSTLQIDLTMPAYSALNNTGGFVVVSNVIVINTGGGNYTALSAVCTHEGAIVTYNAAANNIFCSRHGSVFAIGGSVVTGPATQSLAVYPVTKAQDILTIQR